MKAAQSLVESKRSKDVARAPVLSLQRGAEKDPPRSELSQDLWVSVESAEQKTRSVPLEVSRGWMVAKDWTRSAEVKSAR